MISLIICSRRVNIPESLKQNIELTIGVEFEFVIINNSEKKYSISSAYAEGVCRSKGDILCFMHDDILFHTKNWGESIVRYFNDYPMAGMIGVVGSHFMPKLPSAWWDNEALEGHLLQGHHRDGQYSPEIRR